jgi:hypothetical protein
MRSRATTQDSSLRFFSTVLTICVVAIATSSVAADLPVCSPAAGTASIAAAELPENPICRPAYFWETRAGYEHGHVNLTQRVIDAAGGLSVCGELVTKTVRQQPPPLEDLGLSSALQGLCVRTQGVRQRQLYRQLLATSLNCAMSDADDCDALVDEFVNVTFSECDAVCAGTDGSGGPSMQKCIKQLRCFNVGGRIVEGGDCALGNCASQKSLYCGADFGACPLINDRHQGCREFADNCYQTKFCQESLGICYGATPRSSRAACRTAAFDDCTIDSCP